MSSTPEPPVYVEITAASALYIDPLYELTPAALDLIRADRSTTPRSSRRYPANASCSAPIGAADEWNIAQPFPEDLP